MGTYVAAYEVSGGRTNGLRDRGSHGTLFSCRARSTNLLAVLALAMLAGFTSVALQFMATKHSWVEHAGEFMRSEAHAAVDASGDVNGGILIAPILSADDLGATGLERRGGGPLARPAESKLEPQGTRDSDDRYHRPGGGSDIDLAVSPAYRPEPRVDHRFVGQNTGIPPKPEEEPVYRPPPSQGPFGWGTHWAIGVTVLDDGEDVIEPSECRSSAEDRSFVEHVMERRSAASVDNFNRVRFVGSFIFVHTTLECYQVHSLQESKCKLQLLRVIPLLLYHTIAAPKDDEAMHYYGEGGSMLICLGEWCLPSFHVLEGLAGRV